MGICEECGAPLVDDRGCSYCEGTYCQAHQLPEHHDCPGVRGADRGGSGDEGDNERSDPGAGHGDQG